eukprot:6698035-Alexandrium_andersonii.AAC.1
MSASLVGSEMCIRDSSVNQQSPTCATSLHERNMEVRKRLRQTTSAGTVSYTHLTLPTICSV